eukprot:2771880-Rhodomonas_salina.2
MCAWAPRTITPFGGDNVSWASWAASALHAARSAEEAAAAAEEESLEEGRGAWKRSAISHPASCRRTATATRY